MRFSIRDLIWLTAVVALAATVYVDRVKTKQMVAQWQQLHETELQRTTLEMGQLRATINGLRQQNALVQHQLVIELEKARQRDDEENRQRAAAILSRPGRTRLAAPIESPPDESEH